MTGKFIKGRALVIGVAAYRNVKLLPKAVIDDARAVAGLLADASHCAYDPANVELLLDDCATLAAIRAALDRLSGSREDESLFIYFSGHGGVAGAGKTSRTYLLPVEAESSLPETMLSDEELSDRLKQLPAQKIVVVLDACHAGGAAALKASDTESSEVEFGYLEKSLNTLGAGKGRVVLASSTPSEKSRILPGATHSLFTTHLLDGLKGRGEPSGSDVVRVFNLFEYVSKEVKQASSNCQTPVFKANLTENFAIAMLAGGFAKAGEIEISPQNFDWDALLGLLTSLYPRGPAEQNVWQRAGGDLATIVVGGTGRSDWFGALQQLRNGGGGSSISAQRLFDTLARDFPNNAQLRGLIG